MVSMLSFDFLKQFSVFFQTISANVLIRKRIYGLYVFVLDKTDTCFQHEVSFSNQVDYLTVTENEKCTLGQALIQ